MHYFKAHIFVYRCPVTPALFVEKAIFPPIIAFEHLSKSVEYIYEDLFLGSLFCPSDQCVYPSSNSILLIRGTQPPGNFICHSPSLTLPPEPSPPVRGKTVFHETGPWCQKCWGPLLLIIIAV